MSDEVKVGQVWSDNDKRCKGRTVTVLRLHLPLNEGGDAWAEVKSNRGKISRINLRRFRTNSTGYVLVRP